MASWRLLAICQIWVEETKATKVQALADHIQGQHILCFLRYTKPPPPLYLEGPYSKGISRDSLLLPFVSLSFHQTIFNQDLKLYYFISKTDTGKREKDQISYILKTKEKYRKKRPKKSERTKQGVLAIVKKSRWDNAYKE